MSNPYQSPQSAPLADPKKRVWKGGRDAVLVKQGLLQRKVIVNRPVEVAIEYFARGIRDSILVDGQVAVTSVPILFLRERFDFKVPCADRDLPAVVSLKLAKGTLRITEFEIVIDGVVAYQERSGQQVFDAED